MNINDLQRLNLDQYEKCKSSALERVQSRIGDKPTRDEFKREFSGVLEIMDGFLLIVFVAAFVVSSLHIADHMSINAVNSFNKIQANQGLRLPQDWFVGIHQFAYILLAEFAMLSFFTAWQIRSKSIEITWRKYAHPLLFFALAAAVFVVIVNVQSGVGILEGIMPPLFTIGIGFRLETIASELIVRRAEIDKRYLAALHQWEQSSADPTKHPDYKPMLMQEIWQYLTKLKANKEFTEASPAFKRAAVAREMAVDKWSYADMDDDHVNPTQALEAHQHAFSTNGTHRAQVPAME